MSAVCMKCSIEGGGLTVDLVRMHMEIALACEGIAGRHDCGSGVGFW